MLAGEESDTDGEPRTGFTIGQQRRRLFLPCSEQPGFERLPVEETVNNQCGSAYIFHLTEMQEYPPAWAPSVRHTIRLHGGGIDSPAEWTRRRNSFVNASPWCVDGGASSICMTLIFGGGGSLWGKSVCSSSASDEQPQHPPHSEGTSDEDEDTETIWQSPCCSKLPSPDST